MDPKDPGRVVKLQRPIKHGDEEIVELRLREITVADMRAVDGASGRFNEYAIMIAALSGYPLKTIDRLHVNDFGMLIKEVDALMGKAPGIGKS